MYQNVLQQCSVFLAKVQFLKISDIIQTFLSVTVVKTGKGREGKGTRQQKHDMKCQCAHVKDAATPIL